MPITCVTADVSLELPVVAERHLTVRAPEPLGPLLLAGRRRIVVVGGCRSGNGGRRVMMLDQRFESGHLVKFADLVGSHSQSGQTARMQSFGGRLQRSQESFHRRSFRLEVGQLVVVVRMESVGGDPSGEERRRLMVLAQDVSGVSLVDGRVRISGGRR